MKHHLTYKQYRLFFDPKLKGWWRALLGKKNYNLLKRQARRILKEHGLPVPFSKGERG